MSTQNQFYDRFYSKVGWKYDIERETKFMSEILVPRSGWKPGDRVIEIGAGNCQHAEILRKLGFDITAVEASPVGVTKAREDYPELDVVCADAGDFVSERPGHVYARGMSWYHYEQDGVNRKGIDVPAVTARTFDKLVAPGHTFVMQIITDFSGSQKGEHVHMNTEQAYRNLFSRFGPTKIYDWSGNPVGKGSRGVIVVTEKQ